MMASSACELLQGLTLGALMGALAYPLFDLGS